MIARIDEEKVRILSSRVRSHLHQRLAQFVDAAVIAQHRDGGWSFDWHPELQNTADLAGFSQDVDSLDARLLVTSHLAEWMVYLPKGLQVPEKHLRRAGMWLENRISTATPEAVVHGFCPYSHAVWVLRQLSEGR